MESGRSGDGTGTTRVDGGSCDDCRDVDETGGVDPAPPPHTVVSWNGLSRRTLLATAATAAVGAAIASGTATAGNGNGGGGGNSKYELGGRHVVGADGYDTIQAA